MRGSGLETDDILYGEILDRSQDRIRPDEPEGSRLAMFSDQELIESLFTDRHGAFEDVAGYSGNHLWCVRSELPGRWVPADWGRRLVASNGMILTEASDDLDRLPLRNAQVQLPGPDELHPYQLIRSPLWTTHACILIAIEELNSSAGTWMIPAGLGRERLLYVGETGDLLGAAKVIPNRRYG